MFMIQFRKGRIYLLEKSQELNWGNPQIPMKIILYVGLASFENVMVEGVELWIYKQTTLCQTDNTSQIAVLFKMIIHKSEPSCGRIVRKGQN